MNENTDFHTKKGVVRTDLYCHQCQKNFVAKLDHDIDGNHCIECPHCTHEHCRVIKNGKVTADRYDSKMQRINVKPRLAWSHQSLPIETTVACHFLRERWLNRDDAS